MRGARRCSNSATTSGRGSTFSLRSHKCGELSRDHVGQSVTLYGWIRKPRVLGSQGVAFLPVYDTTGVTQFSCNAEEWRGSLDTLKSHETVVKAMGVVRERPAEAVNTNTPTGEIEVELEALEVLNEATNLPFATFGHGEESVTVEQQLRERQLYLRLPHMQRNIRLRSKVAMALREALVDRHDFVEIETPTLFKRTPEGAQEFIVPTKTRGKFFSLAQSPQQFKQLLMVSGFDRYFQFARCYRDEDQRSDRQPEFTQVDLEMSFVDSECVMGLTEELLHSTISSLCPELSLPCLPFPRMEYRQAMEQYGSDKPDTRYEMKLQDLGSIWRELIKEMGMDNAEKSPFSAHIYGLRVPKWEQALLDINSSSRKKGVSRQIEGTSSKYPVAMLQRDQSSSGNSLETLLGSHFPPALLNVFSKSAPPLSERFGERVKQHLGWGEGDLCVLATSKEAEKDEMLAALGAWRTLAAQVLSQTGRLELSPQQLNFLWVSDFPLFSVSEKKRGLHSVESTHHPFTAPVPEHEHMLQGNPSLELLPQVITHQQLYNNMPRIYRSHTNNILYYNVPRFISGADIYKLYTTCATCYP